MKFFRKIVSYFGVALLAFANLGAYVNADGQVAAPKHDIAQTFSAAISSHHDTLFCLTEQKSGSSSFQNSGSITSKHSVPKWLARDKSFNAGNISKAIYYQISRHLLPEFTTTDIVFPFHQFW